MASTVRSRGRWFVENLERVRAAREALPAEFKPQKNANTGAWMNAKYSARDIARLRRRAQLKGVEWPFEEVPKRVVVRERQFKTHKKDALATERRELVRRNMARMDEMVEKYRAAKRAAKVPKKEGLALLISQTREQAAKSPVKVKL